MVDNANIDAFYTRILSNLSTLIFNLDSSRGYNTTIKSFLESSDKNKKSDDDGHLEGWTEVWGNKKNDEEKKDLDDVWRLEDVFANESLNIHLDPFIITTNNKTPLPPPPPLILTQYRMAWYEQAIFRFLNIPHIVINTPHATSESTGPYPQLADFRNESFDQNNNNNNNNNNKNKKHYSSSPALVGRYHPTITNNDDNGNMMESDIIQYCLQTNTQHLDSYLNPVQKADQHVYHDMIIHTLNDIVLKSLRYGDASSWKDVGMLRCLRAHRDHGSINNHHQNGNGGRLLSLMGWWQASSERNHHLYELLCSPTASKKGLFRNGGGRDVDSKRVISLARSCYEVLEAKLSKPSDSSSSSSSFVYLLGTDQPTSIDASLFSHLAEALCDVHLIVILSSFPNLIEYFRHIYESYFGTSSKPDDHWTYRNDITNAHNCFNFIPMSDTTNDDDDGHNESKQQEEEEPKKDSAADIMRIVSFYKRDLQSILDDVASQRALDVGLGDEQDWTHPKVSSKDDDEEEDDDVTKKTRELVKKMHQESRSNDEFWIAGVLFSSVVAYMIAAAASSSASS